jgi:transcriptional regulator with XRE-family HTH domain
MRKKVESDIVSKIAENVRKLKKQKGLTKSDLVRKTDLDYHTIAKLEKGRTPDPRINTLVKIAEAFGEPVKSLIE